MYGNLSGAIERLESIGAVNIRERLPGHRTRSEKIFLESGSAPTLEAQPRFILNSEQEQAFRKIDHRLKEGGFETFLLHGVTGSGKTESISAPWSRPASRAWQSYTDSGDLVDTPADRSCQCTLSW